MPTVALSASFVRRALCPDGRKKIDFFDACQRGFMLEVRCSGGKTYYQRYTDERGRERQYKLGPADVLTLDQARRKARRLCSVRIRRKGGANCGRCRSSAASYMTAICPMYALTRAAGGPMRPFCAYISCRRSASSLSTRSRAMPFLIWSIACGKTAMLPAPSTASS
jgi:Arm DNA-binding domain